MKMQLFYLVITAHLIANLILNLWVLLTFDRKINKTKVTLLIWLLPVIGFLYVFRNVYLGERKLPKNPYSNTEDVRFQTDSQDPGIGGV